MAVHLTRIYTRTGDAGTTALGDGSRVHKTDPRITAYADTDECNAAIGVALALGNLPDEVRAVLTKVQNDLFDVGADLSVPIVAEPRYPTRRISEHYVLRLEGWCDEFNARLSTLDSFILPGGTPGAALLHVARTIARRAERNGWAPYQHWPAGRSWRLGDGYLVIERSPALTGTVHDRCAPGLNHLAFHAGTRAELDGLVRDAPGYGWSLLFPTRHPFAGGPEHYAAYLEDRHGYEVELVAGN